MLNCLNGFISPLQPSNKISPLCLLINGGEMRHKLAGLMGLIPLKCHKSYSREPELAGEQMEKKRTGKGTFTK